MNTKSISAPISGLILALGMGLAQETPPLVPLPAANPSQANCTGFITSKVSQEITVLDGANNDLQSVWREFMLGESIYLYSRHKKADFSVGQQFSIIRPAKELFRTTRYGGEHWTVRSLGTPYEDAGRVQVTHLTPEGAVAQVNFACGPIYPGDVAVLYEPRPIPTYLPGPIDRFALPNGNIQGTIAAARNNFASLGIGDVVYLNFGEKQGAKFGQKYRVFRFVRPPSAMALFVYPPEPRETIGEIVVLSTQEKSAVAIIVNSTRDINVGYGVELE